MSGQPPWDPYEEPQEPGLGEPQYPPPRPYGQQPYPQGQPPWNPYDQPQDPNQYQGQPPQPPNDQQSYPQEPPSYNPQGPYPPAGQPPSGPQHGQPPQKSWPRRHKVLTGLGGFAALVIAGAIGAAGGSGATKTVQVAVPGPTVTVAAPAVTATVTVAPTQNAQGEATQISADGVYVIGTDIAGGTWHTSGGSQCYEATLASTDTSNIIDNNNFTGPDTVDLSGAKAFEINGGCTWQHE